GLLDSPDRYRTADMRKDRNNWESIYRSLADQPIMRTPAGFASSCRIDKLMPGEYAAFVAHDRNRNGKLDANLIGIPKEPFGMSNDFKPKLFPVPEMPSWKKAAFQVQPGENRIRITIQN